MVRILTIWAGILAMQLVLVGTGDAGFDRARIWFERLAETERRALQRDLVLAGFFRLEDCIGELIDARLGPVTYDALKSFETRVGARGNGYLQKPDREALAYISGSFQEKAGFGETDFHDAGIRIPVPRLMLEPANRYGYAVLSSDDESLTLEPIGLSDRNYSFHRLYQDLTQNDLYGTADYVKLRRNHFVVIGHDDVTGRRFFAHFRRNVRYNSGFILRWDSQREAEAASLAIHMAANMDLLPLSR